jgi:two-component system sensor histidine kinase CpxA
MIIAIVGLLPLLQQNHDRAPLPPNLEHLLTRFADRIIENPEIIKSNQFRRLNHRRGFQGKPVRFYLVNDLGVCRTYRRFLDTIAISARPYLVESDDEADFQTG